MFHLIRNSNLEVTFDISGADDHLPSVAFNIGIAWKMPFKKARIEITECWFECLAIDAFHSELKALMNLESGTVTLSDLSHNPIFAFAKFGNDLVTTISTQDTFELGQISLKVKGYSPELSEVAEKLGAFEKWW